MKKCLVVESKQRPTMSEVVAFYEARLSQDVKDSTVKFKEIDMVKWDLFRDCLRSTGLPIQKVDDQSDGDVNEEPLWKLGVNEVYCLWRLAGGDLAATMTKQGPQKV